MKKSPNPPPPAGKYKSIITPLPPKRKVVEIIIKIVKD